MTRLTLAIERLVDAVAAKPSPVSQSLVMPEWKEPERFRAPELLLLIPGIGQILRDNFNTVPESYYERRADHSVVIACPCGRRTEVAFGTVERCDCLRFYVCLRTRVAASKPPAPNEIFICDGCSEDLPAGRGTWVDRDSRRAFVCEACAA